MAMAVRDDLGRECVFPHPPRRVVSLVPSDTHSLFSLGVSDRLVGRTRFCVEPAEAANIPDIGGTKDADVDAIAALAPDLVLCNKEENTQTAVLALASRGIPVWVSFPRRVADGWSNLAKLARVFGVDKSASVKHLIARGYRELEAPVPPPSSRAFVPIWNEPLMTMNSDTYGSDMLRLLGLQNVFEARQRMYPLGADMGLKVAWSEEQVPGRDRRYPRVSLEEVQGQNPDLILLPDEPFAFTAEHIPWFRERFPAASVRLCSGKDLFWYGAWSLEARARLADRLEP